ncbi:AAA family ATPase [Paenibacillus lactis]|uniref:Nuclease SbcCD subunit C n=1 Tax=Paenibacillus lactis 154 TaxID=743719 RepID=G4HNS0_9BACL|nr:AAA family ATPase [Paenibacillus lactis]EHB50084.1 hypothetical protein PaelaDRAFT_5631 [Paenibacillus lactis 154]
MKKIVLERLTFRNFKGFREFVLDANGGNVDAFGDNATGKTTLFDGFTWLLFGKDSANRSEQKFEIKELDNAGKVVRHGLDHEVEGVLLVNQRRRRFRRVFSEKWTQKRGSATSVFDGHTTNYFVDGVPVKEKEYRAEVDALISEDVFKLLTSPSYFNEVLKPEARRKVLLEVCGDMTDAEIIASNKELTPLAAILEERTVEKHKQSIKSSLAEINKEIKEIPTRIDEKYRDMPDVSDLDAELLQEDIDTLRGRIDAKTAELQRIQSGGELSAKEILLREINAELTDIKHRVQADGLQAVNEQRERLMQLRGEASELQARISAGQREIEQYKRQIARAESQAERLREEWHAANGLEFPAHEHQHDDNCPTCGQALPADQVQAAKDKALADFNISKSQRLERISAEGKAIAEEVRKLKHSMFDLEESLSALETKLAVKQEDVSAAEAKLADLQAAVSDPADDPEYRAKQMEAEAVRSEIEQLRSSTSDAASKVQAEISLLRDQVNELESDKLKIAAAASIEKRIAELTEQERKLAAEYERLQHELYLTEEFTRTKVSALESKINSKFKYARFRLFEEQLNGGLNDVCKTLYNGVPYDGGLNNAAQINVGLDIINTLSEHYSFIAPIFIDNAESVTQLIDTEAQLIRLVVSEKDKKLRVVTHNNMQEAI